MCDPRWQDDSRLDLHCLRLPEVPDAAVIPVSRGAMGQIWRLDLGVNRFAVKELFWEASEESARREAELTARLG